jgi:hypothetical protein
MDKIFYEVDRFEIYFTLISSLSCFVDKYSTKFFLLWWILYLIPNTD